MNRFLLTCRTPVSFRKLCGIQCLMVVCWICWWRICICLSEAIDEIFPWHPLHPHVKVALWCNPELQRMKRELRWQEQVWWCTCDGAARTSDRMFIETYKMTVKTAKKFYKASISSVNSHPAQLFRPIQTSASLLQGRQNERELSICCKAFVKYFTDKNLFALQGTFDTVHIVKELETPYSSSGSILR